MIHSSAATGANMMNDEITIHLSGLHPYKMMSIDDGLTTFFMIIAALSALLGAPSVAIFIFLILPVGQAVSLFALQLKYDYDMYLTVSVAAKILFGFAFCRQILAAVG
jgi:hypothetical protein